jgi:N utilization substance protein A
VIKLAEITQDHLKYFSEFQRITGIYPADCIDSDSSFIFLVENRGELYKCIGKENIVIKNLVNVFKKPVFVFIKGNDVETQLRNIFYNLSNMSIKKTEKEGRTSITLIVQEDERGYAVGKGGIKIKGIRELLSRIYNIRDFQLRTTKEFRADEPQQNQIS